MHQLRDDERLLLRAPPPHAWKVALITPALHDVRTSYRLPGGSAWTFATRPMSRPRLGHNGWWLIRPSEMRSITEGVYLELANEFEVAVGG